MKKHWGETELSEYWSLSSEEYEMIESYSSNNRLGIAVQLKYIQIDGSFPRGLLDIPPLASEYLSQQLNTPLFTLGRYEWDGRSVKRHRQHIRNFLGYRTPTSEDAKIISDWLKRKVLPFDHNPQHIQESVIDWCRHNRVESPTEGRLERIINSAAGEYENELFESIHGRLSGGRLIKSIFFLKPILILIMMRSLSQHQ